jgi:hypothetical protein
VGKVSRAPIEPLGGDCIGVRARRKQLDRGVQICEIRPLSRNPFFEVVNVPADFSALEAKGGDDMLFSHAPNLGADPIHFLWQLRHNTGNSLFFSLIAGNLASETGSPLTGSSATQSGVRGIISGYVRTRDIPAA